jgi:outer membrane protein OmpA-like peptidoglycan-associated protein
LLLTVLCLWQSENHAQNLVLNGSFEEHQGCPIDFNQSQLTHIVSWKQSGQGTPDYFNSCSKAVGVPNNVFGKEAAATGQAYAGFVNYTFNKKNYREYLSSELSRPLKPGELVCIEISISSADLCNFVTDGCGIVLSVDELKQKGMACIEMKATIENPRLYILDQKDGWVKMGDVYRASGGERFITIGNFKSDKSTKILHSTGNDKGMGDYSYLYVDDVVVKPVKTKEECSCENEVLQSLVFDPPLQLSQYDVIRLDDVLFDFDKFNLTDSARKDLDEVYVLLKKNKAMYLEVQGHTDSRGKDDYNVNLSKNRAEAVVGYLVKKGIDKSRLEIKYFGATKPVSTNDSDEGRAKNRRVEFRVLKKRFELIENN